ncbi:hypothetical protein RUM43_002785 [Polyplax serrata]|uniref:Transcription termination factor 2 n=1 Tax=Polyplax serrata TaxID=468196 RepID=A0AAN8PZY8_POLSC
MAHKFQKNKYISDSESDEESLHSSPEESDSDEESLHSTEEGESDSSASSDVLHITRQSSSPDSVTKSRNKKRVNPINHETSSDISVITNSSINNISQNSGAKKHSPHQVPKEDCNENHLWGNSSETSKQSVVESSIGGRISDVLVVNSSTSFDSVSAIDCSGIEKFSPVKEPLSSPTKNIIVDETSDSDESVECLNTSEVHVSTNSGLVNHTKESQGRNSDIAIIETSIQTNNESTASVSRISSPASDISNVTQSSTCSLDERRTLEQQLIDKRTAYQNILSSCTIYRAVKLCDPKRLKDGGKLLQEKLATCKQEVDELKEKLRSIGDAPNSSVEKHQIEANLMFSTTDQVTDNLGKKGLETHSVHQALTFDSLVTLHNSIETCPGPDVQEEDPRGLLVNLMPHQKYALAWLLWREKQVPASGILADDMGLGKTLTMISLILRSREYKKLSSQEEENGPVVIDNVKMYHGKTLVVCPSSLLGQWQGQIKQHCKSHILTSYIHHGKPRELQAKNLAACDIVITSYGVVVEENKFVKGNKKGPLHRVKWERIILDEGHVIRNHKTKTAQSVCELEAKNRWCLTGTPVQNKELDMYSLLKFLQCSPFDNLTVWKRWVDNKSLNGTKRLNTILKSILLRRTKKDLQQAGGLKELPDKCVDRCALDLDEEEQKMLEKDSCAEDGIDVEDDPILQDLTKQMKRMSVIASKEKIEEDDSNHKILVDSNPVFEINRPSTKVKAVVDLIKEALEADDKIVVVSQWANFLRKLKVHIEPLKTGVVTLDGSIPTKNRTKIIDDFNDPNSDVKIMLLSLTAGGVGLNLVGGNRLIIVEPHWNPQLESQACDRIYRVGQKKKVKIFKLICKNTIEEKIETLQEKKLALANTVLKGEVEMSRSKLTLADIKILFDFESEPRRRFNT